MAELPRLNNVIRALEAGKPAFASFAQAEVETATAMSASKFDGVIYEMEHNFWDARALRDAMQYMLNRRQIAERGAQRPRIPEIVLHLVDHAVELGRAHGDRGLDLGLGEGREGGLAGLEGADHIVQTRKLGHYSPRNAVPWARRT